MPEKTGQNQPDVAHAPAKSLAVGAVTGVVNGMFGGGGGLVLVPLLKKVLKLPIKVAHASAIGITIMMSLMTLGVYLTGGVVTLGDAIWFMVGGAVGGFFGAKFLKKIPKKLLKKGFALFLLYSAVRMMFFG
ncbi:TSUP family transporter [Feifania hominis]|uniref:Probable membrane transporter protein n=1 Tax=Feifania hominis TaxID=2763660 RepID=A0A926DBM3_9FIRM|nr:TSUP family transporter [Feifania hominis]MBC8535990.1 TSUP family transporter [Feifania hominis]